MKKRFLALVLISVLVLTLLASCSSYNKSTRDGAALKEYVDYDYTYSTSTNGSFGTKLDYAVTEDMAFEPEAPAMDAPAEYEKSDSGISSSSNSNVTAGRKIIYSSNFNLETKEFDKSIASLDALCLELGAWYESSNSYGTAERGNRNAYFTVRVPAENYRAFVSRQGSIGVVISSSENNRDVTEQYTDIEARLASATLREERVLKILENADLLDEVLTLERELADIRYEIEHLTGSLRKYDSQVSYSTVSISIAEVTTVTPPAPKTLTFTERLSKAFHEGLDNFKGGVENLVINASYNLIALIFWIVIILILVIFLIVKIKKLKKKHTQNIPQITDTEPAQAPDNTDKEA